MTSAEACPECGNRIPVNPGYVTWCECGWNLSDPRSSDRGGLFARVYRKLGDRHGAQLFEQLRGRPATRPGLRPARIALFVLSAIVLLAYVALIGAGIWLLVAGWPGLLEVAAALLMLLIAYVFRPRVYRLPKDVLWFVD